MHEHIVAWLFTLAVALAVLAVVIVAIADRRRK